MILGAAVIVWISVTVALRPLYKLGDAIGERSPDDLHPIEQTVPSEVEPLVDTVNSFMVRLQSALDALRNFTGNASHQLRTPLSAINWYGEMLLNGDAGKLTKTQHEYITEIFEGNQRMVELVNSLLDVSRLEVGKLASAPAPTDVAGLVSDLEKELAVSVKEKGLKLKNETAALPPVFADPKQLRMIVQNLLSNAVKYTPGKGTVTVTLRKASSADLAAAQLIHAARPHWFFSVQDTGYGIPKEQQPKIFGKLFRADNVRALDVEGTGLGLAIVKEIVEAMGGKVWFESIEGAGTTFYVVAPFPEQKQVK